MSTRWPLAYVEMFSKWLWTRISMTHIFEFSYDWPPTCALHLLIHYSLPTHVLMHTLQLLKTKVGHVGTQNDHKMMLFKTSIVGPDFGGDLPPDPTLTQTVTWGITTSCIVFSVFFWVRIYIIPIPDFWDQTLCTTQHCTLHTSYTH